MAQEEIGIRVVVGGVAEAHRQLGAIRNDLSRVASDISGMGGHFANFSKSVVKAGDAMVSFGRTLTFAVTAPIVGLNTALINAGANFEDAFAGVSKTVEGVALGFDEIATSMYGTTKGLSDVQKQAVFANDSFGDLTKDGEELRNIFRGLALEIPLSADEFAKIGQVAGQLGVRGTEQIKDFTETIALLSVATDLTSEQAAFAIARMGNIMGVATADIGKFAKEAGNAIVALGNTSAATESEIVNLAYRISGAGRAVGLTMQEILGLSASLAAAGIKAEMGGSAVSRILTTLSFALNNYNQAGEAYAAASEQIIGRITELRKAIESGLSFTEIQAQFSDLNLSGLSAALKEVEDGTISLTTAIESTVGAKNLGKLQGEVAEAKEQLVLFAKAAGMSEQALANLIKTDPTKAFQLVLEGISKMQEAGTLTSGTLNDLELNTIRLKDVILRLGPNMGMVTENINTANEAWTEQIALQEEAAKRFNTFKSQLQLLKNAFTDLGITVFDLVKDDLTRFVNILKEVINFFKVLDPAVQKSIIRIAGIAAIIGPAVLVLGTLAQVAGNAGLGLGLLIKPLETLIRMPFSPLLGMFSMIFGTKGQKGQKGTSGILGGIKSITKNIGGVFGSIFSVIPKALSGVFKIASKVVDSFFKDVARGAAIVVDKVADIGKNIVTGAGSILKAISSIFLGPLSAIFSGLGKVLTLPFDLVGGILKKTIIPLIGNFGKIFTGVIGGVAKGVVGLGGKLLGFVPTIGKFFFSGIMGIFTKLPLMFAGALALMFAPKIISGVVKNWDAVLGELKTSFKQFTQDIKDVGLTKAIMLFVSGGSTGSGRKGGILGIAKAMGASEDSARKFSYALGTATHWIIKIVGSFGELIKRLGSVVTGTKTIGGAAQSTGDRLSNLTASFAKFFEGFFVGWTGKFDKVVSSFTVFVTKIREAASSFSGLFDEIFGKAEAEQKSFQEGLEPGVKTAASSIGETVGAVIGDILTLAIQTLTLLVTVAGKVAEAFTAVVAAYKEGGLKGVFEELEPILAGLFQGILFAADALWDNVKPKLTTFVDNIVGWFKSDGGPALLTGASNLINAIGAAFNGLWNGFNIEQQTPVYGNAVVMPNGEEIPFQTGTEEQTVSFEGIKPKLQAFIDSIKEFLTSDETKQAIKDGFSGAIGAIVDVAKYIWEGGEGFGGLKGPFTDLLDNISTWVTTTGIPAAKKWGEDLGQSIINGIADKLTPDLLSESWKTDKAAFKELIYGTESTSFIGTQSVTDASGNLMEDFSDGLEFTPEQIAEIQQRFKDAGLIIPPWLQQGLDQGFLDEENARLLAGYDIADDIINATKEQLGIESPSTVFQDIGVNVIEGLVLGIDSQMGALSTVINTVLTKFLGLQAGISAIALAINTTVSNMLSNLNTVSSIAGIMSANLAGSVTSISNTSVYSPSFYGPPAPATMTANQDIYSQYLGMQGAVG